MRDGVADDGFERWSKEGVKASELARVLELAGHAQPEALRDRRVEVAKRRWQESVGGSAFSGVWAEQTDLRVTVGGAEAQRYRTVAVEGKRGACARPVAQLLSKCRASAVDGTLVFATTSGARYKGVPQNVSVFTIEWRNVWRNDWAICFWARFLALPSSSSLNVFARPKSARTTYPSKPSSTFSGFRSR